MRKILANVLVRCRAKRIAGEFDPVMRRVTYLVHFCLPMDFLGVILVQKFFEIARILRL
jgi:hypothetical protein